MLKFTQELNRLKVIKLNSEYWSADINRGAAKSKLSDYEGAISYYNKAIKLNSLYTKAYHDSARAKEALRTT